MEYKEIFPRYLGIKHFTNIPDKVISSWKKQIKNQPLKYLHNDSTNKKDSLTINQKLLEDPIFSKLKYQILKQSKEYLNNTIFSVEDVQISNSWSYITQKDNVSNNFHHHPNSLISGVFYLTEGSPLIFRTDIHQFNLFQTDTTSQKQFDKSHYQINPQSGLLVLFPSHLNHSVGKNQNNIERISIAFNIIPKGEFGMDYGKLYL